MLTRARMPTPDEATNVTMSQQKGELVIEHRFLKGAAMVRVMHLSVEGAKETKREYILTVNGSNGSLVLRELDTTIAAPFDTILPEEFVQRREAARARGRQRKPGRAVSSSVAPVGLAVTQTAAGPAVTQATHEPTPIH